MKPQLQQNTARIGLLFAIVLAVAAMASIAFNAQAVLFQANLAYFLLSAALFLSSIAIWVYSWGYVIRKSNSSISWKDIFRAGFASMHGALAPMQLGAEALRSIQLKQSTSLPLKESIASSAVVKGSKFLVTGIAALVAFALLVLQYAYWDELLWFTVRGQLDALLFYSLLGGFLVILSAIALFLIPFRKNGFQSAIRWLNGRGKPIPFSSTISTFLQSYENQSKRLAKPTIAFVMLLSALSWTLELAALYFAFASLNAFIEWNTLLSLAVLISVLEKAPFTPRGLGLVELVSFQFLAYYPSTPLNSAQIVAVLVLFGVVRVVVPTLLSVGLSAHWFGRKHKAS